MPKISAPTLEQHRSGTIDRLLDSFGDLVMTRGYGAVSLADVAKKAGLARTAIYNYFTDSESLLFAWTEREVQRTIAILEQEVAEAPTCADKLRVFVHLQLVDFASRHLPPGHEAVQFLQPDTYKRFMHHIEPLEKILRQILDEGIRVGEFATIDPDTTISMVLACIGAERGPIAGKVHTVDEATDRVADFLLRAITATSANVSPPPAKIAAKPRAKKKR